MVEKFKKILHILEEEKGIVYLLALIRLDSFVDEKWSLEISLDGLKDASTASEFFSYIYDLLVSNLSKSELGEIGRISLHTPDEHIVELFNATVDVPSGGVVTLKDQRINGYKILEAYVFSSKKATANSTTTLNFM